MAINIEEYIKEHEDELINDDYEHTCVNNDHRNNDDSSNNSNSIIDSKNEDTEDDEFYDMLHDEYEKKLCSNGPKSTSSNGVIDTFSSGGKQYYFNLLNIFIKYYNDKYNKNENFFSNIKDIDKDTTPQMELFYEMIIEYNLITKNDDLDEKEGDLLLMKKGELFVKEEDKGISEERGDVHKLIKNPKYQQIYCLELPNKECIYSPSLLICLNYLIEHNNSDITNCKIYFLK
jgi:hypothetical protein